MARHSRAVGHAPCWNSDRRPRRELRSRSQTEAGSRGVPSRACDEKAKRKRREREAAVLVDEESADAATQQSRTGGSEEEKEVETPMKLRCEIHRSTLCRQADDRVTHCVLTTEPTPIAFAGGESFCRRSRRSRPPRVRRHDGNKGAAVRADRLKISTPVARRARMRLAGVMSDETRREV